MQDPSRPVTGYPAPNGCPPPQPGVAYPYHANQPNPYPYAYVQPNRASSSRAFVHSFILAMMVAFIVMGVTIFIVWLVLRPRIPEFQVESVSLTNFSASNSSSSITGNWNFRFSVTNPNKKMSISYDVVQCLLFYKPEFISETRIPPFYQNKRNHTFIDAVFSASSSYVDRSLLNDINRDRARGTVSFNVKLLARVGFKASSWRARNRYLRVWCEALPVAISTNSSTSGTGKLLGGPRGCQVGL